MQFAMAPPRHRAVGWQREESRSVLRDRVNQAVSRFVGVAEGDRVPSRGCGEVAVGKRIDE